LSRFFEKPKEEEPPSDEEDESLKAAIKASEEQSK
jgi:hypothetical protein